MGYGTDRSSKKAELRVEVTTGSGNDCLLRRETFSKDQSDNIERS